ncbi:MAG: Fe-S cluster assembly protein SufD [Dehalococcoidia bacterium]|nr:Fe-S cluster assembly protein SufD [Dehalococcoidia bacterium]
MTSVVEGAARPQAFSPAASAELGKTLADTPRMAALRAAAAERAGRVALPDARRERPWKYVDFSLIDLERYTLAIGATWDGNEAQVLDHFGLAQAQGACLAQHNSATVLSRGIDGVTINDFSQVEAGTAAARHFEANLGNAVPAESKFMALHYAFLRGGVHVDVADNAEVTEPVRISREYADAGQLATPHTLITTGANSRVTVIEDYRSDDGDILVLPAVEVFPGPGSQVRYITLHRWGASTIVAGEQRTITDRDSEFNSVSVVTGGRVVKVHIIGSLEGRGSSSEVLGLCLGNGNEYADFYTLQDHIGPDTRSDLLIKAALDDSSRAVYYGLTRVGLGARNADANQENRALLLSKKARADSDPVLEILTNDVIRVAHGATAGPVDEEQLYYLESRGIPRTAAEDLLVRAFLGQVLDRVPDDGLREQLETIVEAKLAGSVS